MNSKTNQSRNGSVVNSIVDINDEVLNVTQLSEMIGITKWGVLKRIERGIIPAHKEGRRWYVLKSEYVAQLRRK